MTALNFPDSATSGSMYIANDKVWVYDGKSWRTSATPAAKNVLTKTVYFTADDIYNSLVTPIELLPAVSGSFWSIDTVVMHLPPNTDTVLDFDQSLIIQYGATPSGYFVDGFLFNGASQSIHLTGNAPDGLARTWGNPPFWTRAGLNRGNYALRRSGEGRIEHDNFRDTNEFLPSDNGNLSLFLRRSGPITAIASPEMLWRQASGSSIINAGTGYADDWYGYAFRREESGRSSYFYIAGTAAAGVITSITESSTGLLPEHINQPLIIYGEGSGNNDAIVQFSATASYVPLVLDEPFALSFTATLQPNI